MEIPTPTTLMALEALNIDAIRNSLQYMPECAYQTFCDWILANPDVTPDWLQLTGVTGLSRLTMGILNGLLSHDELELLLPYTVNITIFNMYEIISDNLAIGLAYDQPRDSGYVQRRKILYAFSRAMVERLRGASRESAAYIIAQEPLVEQVSLFQQSLSPDKHRAIASAFGLQRPDIPLSAIEYSLYPNLIANVESCFHVVETLNGYLSQEMVQKGFLRHYAGLNRLLDDTFIPRDYLIQIAVNTIMVRPVLGYYIAVIAEEIKLLDSYEAIFENGFLLRSLEGAALLVRLLNDLGPYMLEQSDGEREDLIDNLYHLQERERFHSFHDLLLHGTDPGDVRLTRLKKDLKFGEFNLALYQPCRSPSVKDSIEVFHDQIKYLSRLYQRQSIFLRNTLDTIHFETQSSIIPDIISRFVKFHETLYAVSFEHAEGEYAV